MTIALDSNIFIAALSQNESHSLTAQQLIRDIDSGKYQAIASSIVLGEVLSIANAKEAPDIETFFSLIKNLSTVPASDDICLKAGALRKDQGAKLKLPDALHAATALLSNAELFITNDQQLVKVTKSFLATKLLSELK